MSIITIIISAAIAAGISYLLHILDKDNNSMEKVKRYADKRLAEFNQYFQTERKTLDEASAEIETRQAQASAAIRRFEEQISQFKKMTENLQADSNAVHNIEEKITDYDKVVSELIQMTARVEENLENVKKESLVIDKLYERLNTNQKNMDTLEKRIPQIANDFATKNGDQLKLIGNKLLDEYNLKAEQLKKSLATLEENANKASMSFQQEISSVYSSASKKAQELEDEAFKHLSVQAQQRTDAYQKSMNENIVSLKNLFELKMQEVKQAIEERTASVDDATKNKVDEFDKKFNQIYVDLSAKFKQKSSELDAEIEAKSSEVSELCKESNSKTTSSIKASFEDLDNKYKQKLE